MTHSLLTRMVMQRARSFLSVLTTRMDHFKEDIHYTVVETKAADGYILDETAHDVTLRYDDNAPDVVVTTLKLINVPTEPKLPQTGDNANPLLYLGIGALALITGVGVGLRGRKKKNKQ